MSPLASHKVQQREETECDKTPKNNAISPLLGSDSSNQPINARHLTGYANNPPINVRQCFPLLPKTLVDRIRLSQHAIYYTVAALDPLSFIQHVICFGRFRIRGTVGRDVIADVGKKVRSRTRIGD